MTESIARPGLTILAVEDDPAIRSLMKAMLIRANDPTIRGALLLEAASLNEARLILAREAVDLVLLDVHLRDGLGLDLATELRRGPPDRPAILALTASVLPAEQQAALDAGCDGFLAKPYSAAALISAVSALVLRRANANASRLS